MNKLMKRGFALIAALLICIPFLPIFALGAGAADSVSNTVDYKYSGSYIYNWGEREEIATFLSPNAIAFYEKLGVTYEKMADYAGGTSKSSVPSSEMYKELAALMKSAHKKETSYNATRELYRYTDCENNGSKISSFYSGVLIGPDWDGGSTWNREHTWPNSKGLAGNDENDIMMLRPTSSSENFSRGNKAYGKSSGYYFPNSESNGDHDVRGDVARIFLYVYVRWGNTTYAWGQSGVMESPEVLLEWMEADPVDTWELGRNDSVEAITGTRNVFVDYPELGFILFGEEVPSDMTTPSGNAKNGTANPPADNDCNHVYTNDCDTDCNLCGYVRVAIHVYANDCDTECDACGYVRVASAHIYSYACDTACNACGAERAAKHICSAWQVIKEATEDEAGLEKGKCIYCTAEIEREIPKLGSSADDPSEPNDPIDPPDCANGKHAFSDWEVNKNGKEEHYCTECGLVEEKSNEAPKCEHTFSEWEETDSGKKERYCTECGMVEAESTQDSTGTQGEPNSDTSGGFFAKIADFFKNIFSKIFSIFKKKK